jgi:predicted ATPase/DNA-binding SARP family transcriptional activator
VTGSSYEFGILGPLAVSLGGRECAVPGPRVREVLAVLLVHPNRPVTADELADELWREQATDTAHRTVHVQIARLRRALGPALGLVTTAAGYVLRVGPQQVDALVFEQHVERARDLPAEDRAAELGRALALWRGPALAEFPDLPSVRAEAARLAELRLTALEARAEAKLELGSGDDLVADLRRLADAEPYRERVHALLMLALYRTGRQTEALAVYRDMRQRLVDELAIEPGEELRGLEVAILAHDPSLGATPAPAATGIPPAPATPTFGREDELAAVTARLADDAVRLLTITGPGGVGKTRLAIEAARVSGGRFVALAATGDADLVPAAVCDALAVPRMPDETAEAALARTFADRRALLVLDNLEHVLAAGTWLARLLDDAPALTVLATSREPLGLRAEQRFPLDPLPLTPAVALFDSRARSSDPRARLDDLESMRAICERLDGLPLAIELAAGRLGVLDPAALAARLSDALGVLGRGARDAPARHRTLRATLDWSFALLADDEQRAFTALGAFAGGCDVEAAEAVTGAGIDALDGLVAKSLVMAKDGRLTLLEPIRQYAVQRLDATPDAEDVRALHAAYYLAQAEETRQEIWQRGTTSSDYGRLHLERDNLRAALTWALEHRNATTAAALAGAIDPYLVSSAAYAELSDWCRRALAIADDTVPAPLRARAHAGCAQSTDPAVVIEQAGLAHELYHALGDDRGMAESLLLVSAGYGMRADFPRSFATAEAALRHAERTGDEALIGLALGGLARGSDRIDDALPYVHAAVDRLREAGALERVAGLLSTVAFGALAEDAFEQAEDLLAGALDAVRRVRNPFASALVHGNRGLAALLKGRLPAAAAAFAEQIAVARAAAFPTFYMEALLGFAALAAARRDDHGAALLAAASEVYDDRGVWEAEKPVYDRVDARFLAAARERLGQAAWDRAGDEARGMTTEAVLALADAVRSAYDEAGGPATAAIAGP